MTSTFTLSDSLWEKLKTEAPLHHRRRAELAFQAGYMLAIQDLGQTDFDFPWDEIHQWKI